MFIYAKKLQHNRNSKSNGASFSNTLNYIQSEFLFMKIFHVETVIENIDVNELIHSNKVF